MSAYDWPPAGQRRILGTDVARIDAPAKASGRAAYTHDVRLAGMLYARTVRCPHAHARVKKIDLSAAERIPGFKAAFVVQGSGTEIFWAGDDVVAVAAEDEHAAEMAMRAVAVEYQVLPHLVVDSSADVPAAFSKPMDPELVGDPDGAFAKADAVAEGDYGLPVITHCCLETHGSVAAWGKDSLEMHVSTQAVAGVPEQLALALKVPQSQIRVHAPYVGSAYGSKLAADRWGLSAAHLSKQAGGAPVRLVLDRREEQEVAGCRPSTYAHVKVGAQKDGTLVAWQSTSWGTGGLGGGAEPPLPYLFRIPNQRRQHTQVVNNIGSARSMRAPHNPQACLVTLGALDDLAAKLGMDPVALLRKNLGLLSAHADVYAEELGVADKLMQWSKRWKPRGTMSKGEVRQGLGVSMHAWPGKAHPFQCDLTIQPDGTVSVRAGTQDLGTGTRTVMAIVAAETLGLPVKAIHVAIGDSAYPVSAASGGSGTVGGSASAVRRAAVDAVAELLARVAPALGVAASKLELAEGSVRVKGGGPSLTWKQACSKLGGLPLSVRGKNPGAGALADSGVGGVQMADVSVDVRTGVVRLHKLVAVQDCGLVVDRKTTTSQVYGSLVMGIGYSLYEEKLMDQNLGRCLNPNMEFYRLCGIGDVGELVVHLMSGPSYDRRGVIGCGEPAVISPGTAISNAVANAIGVRVPHLPLTPDRVLAALSGATP